jgi:hypothetical protein
MSLFKFLSVLYQYFIIDVFGVKHSWPDFSSTYQRVSNSSFVARGDSLPATVLKKISGGRKK